jgi:hypothetical protein
MPRSLLICALLVLVPAVSLAQAPKSNKFGWYGDFSTAKAEAKRSGKPIFLVFRCEP